MTTYEEIFGQLPYPLKTAYLVTLTRPEQCYIAICENIQNVLGVLDEIEAKNDYANGIQQYACRITPIMKI